WRHSAGRCTSRTRVALPRSRDGALPADPFLTLRRNGLLRNVVHAVARFTRCVLCEIAGARHRQRKPDAFQGQSERGVAPFAVLAVSHEPGKFHDDRLQPERCRGLHQPVRAADHRAARSRDSPQSRGGMSSTPEQKKEQKMWGGRFERGPDASFYEFERSWQFDRRLLPQELALDRAWARAIAAAGILSDDECTRIVAALDEIEKRAKTDPAWLDRSKAEEVAPFGPKRA